MEAGRLERRPCCCHTSSFLSSHLPFRASVVGRAQTNNVTAVLSQRRLASLRCTAVAEQDLAVLEDKDLDIDELDGKAFKAMFDNLMDQTKTRYDLGDKVKGIVES